MSALGGACDHVVRKTFAMHALDPTGQRTTPLGLNGVGIDGMIPRLAANLPNETLRAGDIEPRSHSDALKHGMQPDKQVIYARQNFDRLCGQSAQGMLLT